MRPAEVELQERLYEMERRMGGEDRKTVNDAARMIAKLWLAMVHAQAVVNGALETD